MMIEPMLRIHSTPRGEAPLWVREKWVGLDLPLAQPKLDPLRLYTGAGVLSGPKTFIAVLLAWITGKLKREAGFLVGVIPALEVLQKSNPEAAQWWRENASYLVKPGRMFLFQTDCCHVAADSTVSSTDTRDSP
jgi:hypothetical protein